MFLSTVSLFSGIISNPFIIPYLYVILVLLTSIFNVFILSNSRYRDVVPLYADVKFPCLFTIIDAENSFSQPYPYTYNFGIVRDVASVVFIPTFPFVALLEFIHLIASDIPNVLLGLATLSIA